MRNTKCCEGLHRSHLWGLYISWYFWTNYSAKGANMGHVGGKTRPTSSKLKLFSIDVSQVLSPKTPKGFCSLPRTESMEEHVTWTEWLYNICGNKHILFTLTTDSYFLEMCVQSRIWHLAPSDRWTLSTQSTKFGINIDSQSRNVRSPVVGVFSPLGNRHCKH